MPEREQPGDFTNRTRGSRKLLKQHPHNGTPGGRTSSSTRNLLDISQESKKIALSVGCELAYTSPARVPILLLIQPLLQEGQTLASETFISNSEEPIQRVIDAHGNPVIRSVLAPGYNCFRYEAVVVALDQPDVTTSYGLPTPIDELPLDVVRYTMPSRYCESDQLVTFTSQLFGKYPPGVEQVSAICTWIHRNIEYRYGSGAAHLSAKDALDRGFGVCRDLAHVMVALCRTLDLPARYVAGYIPALAENQPDATSDMGVDFHAYCEIFLAGRWLTFDPRHDRPLRGRVKIAHGLDAVDTAIATVYGNVTAAQPNVWTRQIDLA